jgi:hypothetical protein
MQLFQTFTKIILLIIISVWLNACGGGGGGGGSSDVPTDTTLVFRAFPPDYFNGNYLEGGCLYGHIRYRASGPPYAVNPCHCEQCRRYTGAIYATGLTYSAENTVARQIASLRS